MNRRRHILLLAAACLAGCISVPPPPAADGADVADRPDAGMDAASPDARDSAAPVDTSDTDDTPDANVTPDLPSDTGRDVAPDILPDGCEPDCFGRVCGDDGCGTPCGLCDDGQQCEDGICQTLARPWEDILDERRGYGAGTTGGQGASLCVVSSAADDDAEGTLRYCAARPGGAWVRFALPAATVLRPASPVAPGPDTTIDGRGSDVVIGGRGFSIRNVENVILLHLRIENGDPVDENDGVTVQAADRVWIHQCTVRNWTDGTVDVSRDAGAVTISWSHLSDAGSNGSLAGDPATEYHDDLMRLTYHHNWFDGLASGAPRARRATVHVVNNLYTQWTGTAILATYEARVLVEANRFEPARGNLIAVDFRSGDQPNGKTRVEGNSSAGTVELRENGTVPDPSYVFSTESAGSGLGDRIRGGAGRRVTPFPGAP